MSTGKEQWFATRRFKGIDTSGKPCEYTRGDVIPKVELWPTFSSLRNIGWIVPYDPVAEEKTQRKVQPKKAETVEKPEQLEEIVDEPKPKKSKKKPESKNDGFTCDICGKVFKSERALKVHMRYH